MIPDVEVKLTQEALLSWTRSGSGSRDRMDTHAKVKVPLHLRRNLMPLLLAVLACSAGWAAPDEPLPKAEEILDKFVEVTGGKAAITRNSQREVDRQF